MVMKLLVLLTAVAMASLGCAHTQQPERKVYVISEDVSGIGGSGGHDCDAEHNECFDRCWNKAPPISSIKKGSGPHHEYCTKLCREEYMECIEEQEQLEREKKNKNLNFSNIDAALDWLRAHKAEVALGTVVVVAGVAFVVATGGSDALILAPLL
ncbi:hypothetical protein [Vitiosangium sp. GDMCC 1.1324]|uniref:hypothetical protein n=1 Tax=Vitiosangium sp. (strain GDMCC 1.1324) TaxID=2138576 RepID=UPI000D3C1A5B|nr:hypothetical protein [Vitiosangium sp. GDMCC 1.1324]PTL84123.1 hypothetical protein DAT35_11825 [Vitiosangium sp. GDMCC 1.1324]